MASYNIKQYFNFICFGFIFFKGIASACNMTAVNTCTEILSRSSDASVITDGISAIPTVEQLKKLCGAMGDFKACYKPKAAECSGDVVFSMTFGTIENTIEYLCVEGYQDILKYATCWNQTEVIADSTKCHVTQNNMISALHNQQRAGNLNSTTMRNYWCNILDNTTACMREGIKTRCGEQPGCIMHTMMSRALKGLAALMRCPSPEPCQLHQDGREPTHGDSPQRDISDGSDGRHSDGTLHTHGDSHPDHSHEHNSAGNADAEGTPNNQKDYRNNSGQNSVSAIVFFVAMCILGANISYYFV